MTTCEVVRAGDADADVLSRVVADAFLDLAPTKWLIDDPVARRQVFPGYFRLFVEHALADGLVHTTLDRTAAALWLPIGPDGAPQPDGYHEQLPVTVGNRIGRFLAFDEALDMQHPVGIAHYHLAMLAVRPDRQCRGIGTALLRFHHAMLDSEGVPAYLEASGLDTRRIYLGHGYRDHGSAIQLPGGPRMYPMWREPLRPLRSL